MTVRLIALMSLVLLLSLAAFALLMASHHTAVMKEVTHTISVVGRATLRTFELPDFTGADGDGGTAERAIVIRVEDVRAEVDPAHGTLLRIPTIGESEQDRMEWTEEIVLPIPTGEFHGLFAAFRTRTLILFLGVLLVGTVLSASLAARFTRPIRRLDAGIRRLTGGDLEVEVEATGGDEMGRLGRAFNEMTRRLRASRDREREVKRREQLSALGRLAAGVAHDVRNPLHSIGLTLQHLQEAAPPEDPGRRQEFERSIGIIREEISRLDGLVENFLQFARTDRRAKVAIDLGQLLRETLRLVEREAERRGVRIEVVAPGAVPPVPGEVESIRSSILNLILNSFEAMESGGTLTLTIRGADREVELEVADTGHGIPAEDQDRVFEFAYTTREGGHGLGLAMVHQVVVEDHGGRVALESRPGEGTCVRLGFPLAAAEAGAAA